MRAHFKQILELVSADIGGVLLTCSSAGCVVLTVGLGAALAAAGGHPEWLVGWCPLAISASLLLLGVFTVYDCLRPLKLRSGDDFAARLANWLNRTSAHLREKDLPCGCTAAIGGAAGLLVFGSSPLLGLSPVTTAITLVILSLTAQVGWIVAIIRCHLSLRRAALAP